MQEAESGVVSMRNKCFSYLDRNPIASVRIRTDPLSSPLVQEVVEGVMHVG